jgi:hypothetical protein
MKRYWSSVVVVLVLGLLVSVAWVQEDRPAGQRPARGMMMASRGFMGMASPLRDYTVGLPNVTAEQRREINAIRAVALAKVRDLEKQMNEDIKKVLTPEQGKAMVEAERRVTHRGPGGVIMTDAQKKVLDDARDQAEKADTPEARGQIMKDAYEKIQATYTEEQKKQAEESRARFQRDRGTRGGARPGATNE